MSDTRCYYSTNSISIRSTGAITQCCSVGKPIDNVNVFSESNDIINNPYIVYLRNDLNNGIKNNSCSSCWKNEEAGSESFRIDKEGLPSEYRIPDIKKNVITYDDLYWLDIDIGNKCNLACRMCGPWASSLIAKQKDNLQKISGKDVPHWMIGQVIETSISNSVRDKIFEIISKSNNLKRIHLYGGEPLLIDFHDELCEYLIATNRSKTISLTISSNLQVDLHRKLELYNHFNKIHLSISIDGIKDTYEYVRWPGKWEKLKRNIIEWASVAKHHNKVTSSHYNTTITFVLQNINIDNICNFLIEMQKLGVDNHILVERVWGTNLIEIIPTKILEEEIEKLSKLLKVNESDVKFIDVINNAKNLLESCIEQSKNLDRAKVIGFFDAQYQHDMAQNQNLFTTKPYFLELAKQFNIDPW